MTNYNTLSEAGGGTFFSINSNPSRELAVFNGFCGERLQGSIFIILPPPEKDLFSAC
jgi:hypothetical protein